MKRLAIVLALATLIYGGACTAIAPLVPTSFVVPLDVSDAIDMDIGRIELLVQDRSGLVTGATSEEVGVGVTNDSVVAHPELRQLQLTWLGGACAHQPLLTLEGDATHLRIVLDSETPTTGPPVSCPAIGFIFGVTLTLNEPVEQAAIEFTSVHNP